MKKKNKTHRFFGLFIKIIIIFIVGLIGILLFKSIFSLQKVTVTGCEYYTEDDIKKELVTGKWKDNTLLLYLYYQKNNPSIPMIQKIDIEMKDRHELQISIYEKTMVACIQYMSAYLYFDKDGIIVESLPDKLKGVPLISGVDYKDMTLYEPLNVEDDEIFKTILDLSQLIQRYKISVDKIFFSYDKKVTLYSGTIRVRLGKFERYDEQIAKLSNILIEAKKESLKGELNMEDYKEGQEDFYFIEE